MLSTISAADQARRLLVADPRIDAFEVVETGAGLNVTAIGAADWFARRRSQARDAICERLLRQWRIVYERSYEASDEGQAPNFDVWVSGFTSEPIPVETMRIWLDSVLSQLHSVPHGRVLDVGCGSGLVLERLAPGGVAYNALDVSERVVASLTAWATRRAELDHVRIREGAAHDAAAVEGDPVDLAVFNSVAQYFPDASYLLSVLQATAKRIAPGGSIFLGDLRALALLPMRTVNICAARSPDATVGELRAKARKLLESSGEFAIDPGYFQGLGEHLARLGPVRFALKPKAADRELAGYRYDAMLHLDMRASDTAPVLIASSLEAIIEHLLVQRPWATAVLGLPNARLARDAALASAVRDAPSEMAVAELLEETASDASTGLEPDDLEAAARAVGYTAQMRFTPGAPDGRFDALFCRRGEAARWPITELAVELTNDPIGADLASSLRRELQTALEAKLGGAAIAQVRLAFLPVGPTARIARPPFTG